MCDECLVYVRSYLYQFLDVGEQGAEARDEPPLFMPHALTNLSAIDEHESLSPVTDMKVPTGWI